LIEPLREIDLMDGAALLIFVGAQTWFLMKDKEHLLVS